MAYLLIHSLRQMLAPGCLPLFTSEGLNFYFYALTAHFGHWLAGSRRGRNVQKTAGGGGLDLWPGEKKLPAAQAGERGARDAPGNRSCSSGHLAGIRLLGTAQHHVHRVGEPDGASW